MNTSKSHKAPHPVGQALCCSPIDQYGGYRGRGRNGSRESIKMLVKRPAPGIFQDEYKSKQQISLQWNVEVASVDT